MSLRPRDNNSRGPLRPILGQRLKPGGGGSARRALSSLGSSNRRENLRLAESLLTISASEFISKWNFDPLTETPLAQGQFLWTPVKPLTSKVPVVHKKKDEGDLTTCFKLPQKETIMRPNSEIKACRVSVDSVESKDQTVPMKLTCKVSEISKQQVGQICNEQMCQPVKETLSSELTKSDDTVNKIKVCTFEENNNLLPLDISSSNQKQSIITDFMQVSKRQESSPKLRRMMSDG